MSEKQAILVVSFGTSHKETRERTIEAIEQQIRQSFSSYEVRRAFTSTRIIEILKKRNNIHIDTVQEAMEKLVREGFTHVIVQPTHIVNGEEYEKMRDQVQAWKSHFRTIAIGAPLLTVSSDYEAVCCGVMDQFPGLTTKEALVLMGHGTGHVADAAYAAVDYRMKASGYENVFVGTVEGYPALEDVRRQVKKYGPDKVILTPFMVVAGDHAVNDMASNEETSWKSVFSKDGYEVTCVLKGLGEYKEIRDIYIDHIRKVMEK